MAASRFVEVTDKEISEIKINLVPKNTKKLKQLFVSGSVIIGDFVFPDNHLAFGE
jgi:hypothetical protein